MENLLSLTTPYNTRTMFVGETHRVYIPMLTQEVRITVVHDPPTSRGTRAAVYKSRTCPSLTGPKVELQHDSELDLQGGGYVYDYYNLNPGSSVSVWLDPISGTSRTTYFYLLHGAKALQDLQTGSNLNPDYWERIAVVQSYGNKNTEYQTPTRGSSWDYDNIYTLLYDNESDIRLSSVDVKTDISLTTHNLNGYTPSCDYMTIDDSCNVVTNPNNCIIVEAFSVNNDGELLDQEEKEETEEEKEDQEALLHEKNIATTTTTDDGNKTISIRIETYRNWTKLIVLSSIPLFISISICLFLYLWRCICTSRRQRRNNNNNNAISTEPLLASEGDGVEEEGVLGDNRPPPTAPHHPVPEATAEVVATTPQPTAPPFDDNVVKVPPVVVNAEVVTN